MTDKYKCKLCNDSFIYDDWSKIGEHIVWDHPQNEINDFVAFYGAGIETIKQ